MKKKSIVLNSILIGLGVLGIVLLFIPMIDEGELNAFFFIKNIYPYIMSLYAFSVLAFLYSLIVSIMAIVAGIFNILKAVNKIEKDKFPKLGKQLKSNAIASVVLMILSLYMLMGLDSLVAAILFLVHSIAVLVLAIICFKKVKNVEQPAAVAAEPVAAEPVEVVEAEPVVEEENK